MNTHCLKTHSDNVTQEKKVKQEKSIHNRKQHNTAFHYIFTNKGNCKGLMMIFKKIKIKNTIL